MKFMTRRFVDSLYLQSKTLCGLETGLRILGNKSGIQEPGPSFAVTQNLVLMVAAAAAAAVVVVSG